jgi:hypothetical protein
MEFFYNSSEFKAFSDKGGHTTRHRSIADRLKTIDAGYFEQIFIAVGDKLQKQSRGKDKRQRTYCLKLFILLETKCLKSRLCGG